MGKSETWERVKFFIAGNFSGMANVATGHPFETIKVRLQTDGVNGRFKGPWDCFIQTIKTEGIRGLYKGMTPPLLGMGINNSLMFGMFGSLKKALGESPTNKLGLHQIAAAGWVTGFALGTYATPMELLRTRLQTQYSTSGSEKQGPIKILRNIYQSKGIRGLYQGWFTTSLQRSCLAFWFTGNEIAKRALSKPGTKTTTNHLGETIIEKTEPKMSAVASFLAGGFAGACFWTVCFPIDVVKNRLQSQSDDISKRKYTGIRDCVQKILKNEGPTAFFRGFTPALLRIFPANGMTWLAYDLTIRLLP
jgi:solute carrier family 25 carnitine/acylcarnitine transporter 20/29